MLRYTSYENKYCKNALNLIFDIEISKICVLNKQDITDIRVAQFCVFSKLFITWIRGSRLTRQGVGVIKCLRDIFWW